LSFETACKASYKPRGCRCTWRCILGYVDRTVFLSSLARISPRCCCWCNKWCVVRLWNITEPLKQNHSELRYTFFLSRCMLRNFNATHHLKYCDHRCTHYKVSCDHRCTHYKVSHLVPYPYFSSISLFGVLVDSHGISIKCQKLSRCLRYLSYLFYMIYTFLNLILYKLVITNKRKTSSFFR
jgi:hypothetical protein